MSINVMPQRQKSGLRMPIAHGALRRTVSPLTLVLSFLLALGFCAVSGCSIEDSLQESVRAAAGSAAISDQSRSFAAEMPVPQTSETQLEDGLSCVLFEGDDLIDEFLESGGAKNDREVIAFLEHAISEELEATRVSNGNAFGCSFIQTPNKNGGYITGRNFDWYSSQACIVDSRPFGGHSSISTINKEFLNMVGADVSKIPEAVFPLVYEYAPLDGMNERGLSVAVLMIEDNAKIDQDTGKPGITTTTAVRVLLDKASTVDEALEILGACDMHSSFGYMVHFALSDAMGRSVVVEYIDNDMVITETPVVTNFYLTEGPKKGIGSEQSHERYRTLMDKLASAAVFDEAAVVEALESVSKHHFRDGETTEWSQIMDQQSSTVTYFHREDYSNAYVFRIGGQK